MKKSLLVLAGAVALAGSATAADMPAAYKALPPAPVFAWTGCYVGGNIGAAFDRSDFSTVLSPGVPGANHLGSHSRGDVNAFFPVSGESTGFTGGGQVGCNWQSGAFVAGLEGDFNFSGAKPSVTTNGLVGFSFSATNSLKTDWFATIRPRLGWASDTTLFYATGGLAVARLKYDLVYTDTLPDAIGGASGAQTRLGWTVGGGIEHAVNRNWTVKVEYLYSKFNSVAATGVISTQSIGPFTNVVDGSGDLRMQVVRVGFNYKFGSPVVAKY